MQKRPYEAPKVTEVGSVSRETLASGVTGLLDANYPIGTPGPNLFS